MKNDIRRWLADITDSKIDVVNNDEEILLFNFQKS